MTRIRRRCLCALALATSIVWAGAIAAGGPGSAGMPVPPAPVTAPAWTAQGQVRAVDARAGTLTLAHRRIRPLALPAGVSTFRVRDAAFLGQVRAGQKVRFAAEKSDGALVVTHLGLDTSPRRR